MRDHFIVVLKVCNSVHANSIWCIDILNNYTISWLPITFIIYNLQMYIISLGKIFTISFKLWTIYCSLIRHSPVLMLGLKLGALAMAGRRKAVILRCDNGAYFGWKKEHIQIFLTTPKPKHLSLRLVNNPYTHEWIDDAGINVMENWQNWRLLLLLS